MDTILINTNKDYEDLKASFNIIDEDQITFYNKIINFYTNHIEYLHNLIGLNFLFILFFASCFSTCLLKIYKDNKKIKYIAVQSNDV